MRRRIACLDSGGDDFFHIVEMEGEALLDFVVSTKSTLGSKLIRQRMAASFSDSMALAREILHTRTRIFASWSCIRCRNTGHVSG